MAMEAETLADQHEQALTTDRRARSERRGRDRRKQGSRINHNAPTRSTLRRVGIAASCFMITVIVITLAAAYAAQIAVPFVTIAFEAAALAVAVMISALGVLEQRLTEIRLELMMLNGGRRQADDRRTSERRNETQD